MQLCFVFSKPPVNVLWYFHNLKNKEKIQNWQQRIWYLYKWHSVKLAWLPWVKFPAAAQRETEKEGKNQRKETKGKIRPKHAVQESFLLLCTDPDSFFLLHRMPSRGVLLSKDVARIFYISSILCHLKSLHTASSEQDRSVSCTRVDAEIKVPDPLRIGCP